MNRFLFLLSCCTLATGLSGCGPMQLPMPVRLDADGQKAIDESWDKVLSPVDRLDHESLLDLFLCTQAYQTGVDKLVFRSEKKVAVGLVVMEIVYDRLKPDEDRFEMKVYDPKQHLLRHEVYGRKQVEDAYRALFVEYEQLRQAVDAGGATPEETKRLAVLKARRDAIEPLFPAPKAPGKQEK
jgi:hypothetical protein